MLLRLSRNTVIALLVAAVTSVSASAAVGWHTRAKAERNILHAPRALARWNSTLINPQTHLVRTHVTVTCRGLGRAHGTRFARFRCIVRFKRLRIRMTYVAQTDHGFELHGRKTAGG